MGTAREAHRNRQTLATPMGALQIPTAAYLLALPLGLIFFTGFSPHDLARLALLGLGLACSFGLVLRRPHCAANASLHTRWLAACVVVLALPSLARSADVSMAAREAATLAGLAAIVLTAARMRAPALSASSITSLASGSYIAVVFLLGVMVLVGGEQLSRPDLFVGYANYRFFNHTQTAALPLAVLAMTVARRGTWQRTVAWFAGIGGFALLFAVAGRGTMVGIATGALAIAWLFGRASFPTLRNLLLAAAFGVPLFALLFWLLPVALGAPAGLSEEYYGARLGSVEMRLHLWRIALSHIEQAPWFGVGPMHYAHYPTGDAAHPHNVYLQVAAEWGLPMLLLVCASGFVALRRLVLAARRCADATDRNCGIGLVLACVAIAVDGLFSGNFVMPVSQVWIAFTLGWAAAWWAGQQTEEDPASAPGRGAVLFERAASFGLLASQLWLVWSVWPEARQIDLHVQQVMERFPSATMNPRFWSHGWF